MSTAAVYATTDGKVENLDRTLTSSEAVSGRYKVMYEVDLAGRGCQTHDPLPARNDRFHFVSSIAIDWRVTDPAKIVEQRIEYGGSVVSHNVLQLARHISRRYNIEDCESVEYEINKLTASGPVELTKFGITIEAVSASVTLDQSTKDYLQRQVAIERTIDLEARDHNRQQAAQRHTQQLESEQLRAVSEGVQGEFGLIALHLRHHPEQALQVLQLLQNGQQELERRHEARFANFAELFDKMLQADFLQDADAEQLRDALLRNLSALIDHPVPAQAGFGSAPAALAAAPPPATPSAHRPPADPSGVAAWIPRKQRRTGTDGSA